MILNSEADIDRINNMGEKTFIQIFIILMLRIIDILQIVAKPDASIIDCMDLIETNRYIQELDDCVR